MRSRIEAQIRDKVKKPVRSGLSSRLFTGQDVERYVSPIFNEFKEQKSKSIDESASAFERRIETRLSTVFKHLTARVDAYLDGIERPKDGKTPTREEIMEIFTPVIKEIRSSFEKKLSAVTENKSELPADLKTFDDLMRKAVEKYAPKSTKRYGGGGPKHVYELEDVPGKSQRYGAPYAGYENKYLRVKSDGSGFDYVDISVGSANIKTETVTATDAGGNNVEIDLTQLSESWQTIELVFKNGQLQDKNKWDPPVGDILTLQGAVPSNSFQLQYTYL